MLITCSARRCLKTRCKGKKYCPQHQYRWETYGDLSWRPKRVLTKEGQERSEKRRIKRLMDELLSPAK